MWWKILGDGDFSELLKIYLKSDTLSALDRVSFPVEEEMLGTAEIL